MTNGDRIRAMDDEELAEALVMVVNRSYQAGIRAVARMLHLEITVSYMPGLQVKDELTWLKQEEEENERS